MPAILFGIGVVLIIFAMYVRTEFNDKITMSVMMGLSLICWILAIIEQALNDKKSDNKFRIQLKESKDSFNTLISEIRDLRKDLTNKGGHDDNPNNSSNTPL